MIWGLFGGKYGEYSVRFLLASFTYHTIHIERYIIFYLNFCINNIFWLLCINLF